MRIAFVGPKGLPGTFGGVERHAEELGARLVGMGHEVVAYVRPAYTPRPGLVRGIDARLVPTINTKHLDATVNTFLSAWLAGLGKFDIVHFHGIGPAAFAPICRLLGRRVVVTIHSLDYKRAKWGRFAKWALRQAERVAARSAHRLICVSADIAARHADLGARVVHIPNGVGEPRPRPARIIAERWGLAGGDYVLYAGRISPEKGVHHLVRAYREVPGARRLVIAGGTSHTDEYVREIEREKDERTVLVGFQSDEALAELYANAAAFVLPSDHEGMPVALLEAWSYGLACLTSDIGPCREVGGAEGERCRYFRAADAGDLAAKLTALLADPGAAAMAARAREHVMANYAWDAVARRVEEQYRLALGGAR